MPDNATDEDADEPSRSQKRREALDVFKLAEALAGLSEPQLARLPMSEDIREEVRRTRAVTQHIARKRQTQFLAKQLRRRPEEIEPLREALDEDRHVANRSAAELHRIEAWRLRLMSDGDVGFGDFVSQYPQVDRQQLRQLIRAVDDEMENGKPPRAFRELFRLLRETIEQAAERSDQS